MEPKKMFRSVHFVEYLIIFYLNFNLNNNYYSRFLIIIINFNPKAFYKNNLLNFLTLIIIKNNYFN